MKKIEVKSKVRNFQIEFVKDFSFVDELVKIDNSAVVVGSNVYKIYKKEIFDRFPEKKLIILKLDERNKSLKTVTKIYERLLDLTAKKNLTIISFGGGVNQDVVGFATSTLYRGINWIFIPTTLLSMCDSSVGLKTSLNYKGYKNIVGTFYPPSRIIININFLKTLPKIYYHSGIGEIIKFYLLKQNALQNLADSVQKIEVLRNWENETKMIKIITDSIRIKLSYMKGDELDTGRRNLLNYGHEFGHALEPASFYRIPHGLAILVGIIFANIISKNRKLINLKTFDKVNKDLLLPNLSFSTTILKKEYFNEKTLLANMKKDKKIIGNELVLVLPKKDFSLFKINNLTVNEYRQGLNELVNILKIK